MAKIFRFKSASNLELNRRKAALLANMSIPANAVRASCVQQFLTCGKKNCRCRRGRKHGPFAYFVQCMGVGRVNKFLLKTPAERKQAKDCIAAYAAFQKQMEELSQINTELLHRGLPVNAALA